MKNSPHSISGAKPGDEEGCAGILMTPPAQPGPERPAQFTAPCHRAAGRHLPTQGRGAEAARFPPSCPFSGLARPPRPHLHTQHGPSLPFIARRPINSQPRQPLGRAPPYVCLLRPAAAYGRSAEPLAHQRSLQEMGLQSAARTQPRRPGCCGHRSRPEPPRHAHAIPRRESPHEITARKHGIPSRPPALLSGSPLPSLRCPRPSPPHRPPSAPSLLTGLLSHGSRLLGHHAPPARVPL